MAGRMDDAAHGVVLASAADAGSHSKEFLEELENILGSAAFRGSRRSQEFLRHVVERALQGDCEHLKERILGIEIFHRDADYDTGDDAIVRVTASDVRRRLLQYHSENGVVEFRIDLPLGTYVPEFTRIAKPTDVSKTGLEEVPLLDSPAGNGHLASTGIDESGIDAHNAPHRSTQKSGSRISWKTVLVFICVVAAIFWAGWAANRARSSASAHVRETRYAFYKELLGPIASDPHMETEIVLSNPRLFLYRGSNEPNPNEDIGALKIPIPPAMATELNKGANDTQADFPYHRLVLDTEDYTGMGEAKTAFRIGALMDALGRSAHLSEARFLNWDVARSEHFIVLGAPHMSAWTQSGLAQANFSMGHDEIYNSHPLPGEQAVYKRTGELGGLEDYGLIWMSQLPSGSRILVLAGLTSTGTAGVGDFFTNPDEMRPVYEQLKKMSKSASFPSDWQVLLRIDARQNVPMKASVVALRIYQKSR